MLDRLLVSFAVAQFLCAVPAMAQARDGVSGLPLLREARNTTSVGQTKPSSGDAVPTGDAPQSDADKGTTSAPMSDKEVQQNLKAAQERRRARDNASNDLMTRWEFAICIGCNEFGKPFRRVWTNPLRVLAGIPALEDDKRQGRLSIRWTSMIIAP